MKQIDSTACDIKMAHVVLSIDVHCERGNITEIFLTREIFIKLLQSSIHVGSSLVRYSKCSFYSERHFEMFPENSLRN